MRHLARVLSLSTILVTLCVGMTSCRAHSDGYWTKPERSQALTNEVYSADSAECQMMVESNSLEETPTYKAKLFAHCMQAKGYTWIVETQKSYPVKEAAIQPALHCSNGRRIVDAFGFQKCVPDGTKDGGMLQEARRAIPAPVLSHDQADSSTAPSTQPADGQAKDDSLCRQYAKQSLSGTYAVYSQCMRDKGWGVEP